MGKGGKGGGAKAKAASSAPDDQALLDAAVAENKKAQSEAAKKEAKAEAQAPSSDGPSKALPGKALPLELIINKLNQVPTFCILNGHENIVGLKDPTDPTGQLEVCCWFACPHEAKATLASAKEANPDVAKQLHLGVTPLGVAFAFAAGWAECHFFGSKQLRGSQEPFAGAQNPTELLREQAISQGLEPPNWHVPVFCCDELSSPSTMPVFLSRKALAEAWVTSGRKIKEMPENLNVMDLGVLVCQMQTDAFAWATLHFVCERKSIALVKESKQGAMEALALPQWQSDSAAPKLEQGGTPAAPASADDEPPPLM